jgi:acyl-CoA synthetase (AMP-forming)/AMP-acid ligase II
VLSSRGGRNDRSIGKENAMTPMNALFHRAKTRPNGTAFIYDDIAWTYHDLLTGAEQLSPAFVARGVRQGDRAGPPHAEQPGNGGCPVRVLSRRSDRVPDEPAVQDR